MAVVKIKIVRILVSVLQICPKHSKITQLYLHIVIY